MNENIALMNENRRNVLSLIDNNGLPNMFSFLGYTVSVTNRHDFLQVSIDKIKDFDDLEIE